MRLNQRPRALCLLAVPALLASAFAHAAAPVKACDLINQQVASTLLGMPAQPPVNANIACIFKSGDAIVNLNIIQGPDGAPADMMARTWPAILHKDYQTDTLEPIPGLGEQSRFIHSTDKDTLQVLYHNAILSIAVTGSKNPKRKADMIQTAKSALTHW